MTRAFLISLCVFCIIFSLHEQSIFLPVRGCNQENIGFFHPLATAAPVAVTTEIETPKDCRCYMPLSNDFKAQSGQDQYLLHRVFFPQGGLCCSGVYVEFGARNGITHSNTYVFEKNLGWKGLLFEVDEREFKKLVHNRPNSDVVLGPVCPSDMDNVTIILSNIPGFTGTNDTYGKKRLAMT